MAKGLAISGIGKDAVSSLGTTGSTGSLVGNSAEGNSAAMAMASPSPLVSPDSPPPITQSSITPAPPAAPTTCTSANNNTSARCTTNEVSHEGSA